MLPLDDAVDRFIPLDDGTGKFLFDNWTNKIVQREQMLALLPAGVRGDDIKRHPLWISRGAYYLSEVGFDPSGKDGRVKLNTWQGWPMSPKKGCCEKLVELLEYLCSGEVDAEGRPNGRMVARWLLCWMAYPLQHPGAKMASAVIMHGPQGTGKSTVFQALAKIYGDYSTVLNQRGLEDRFNSDWADSKLFILAEEVVTRAEMWHIKNELKELVTGSKIRVNPKNVAAYEQRNQINLVFLSNENQPLPLENDDRRHLVVYTPPSLSEDYYDEVFLELENGGYEAFYHYLINLDLGDFHPKKRPPMTQSKQVLIDLTKPAEIRFTEDWMRGDTKWPFCPCTSKQLYRAYEKWADENGERYRVNRNTFINTVTRAFSWEKKPEPIFESTFYSSTLAERPTFILPDDTSLSKFKGRVVPQDKTRKQYLTDCFFAFQGAEEKD